MMKGKLFVLVAALMSAFVLGSCWSESDSYEYPSYEAVVTVGPDAKILYSDGGHVLKPVNTISGLEKAVRAYVTFDLIPSELNGSALEEGRTYDVELDNSQWYSIPTSSTIDLKDNIEAADSLVNTQHPISYAGNLYVENGYLTTILSFMASQYSPFYVNLAFDSEKDVDLNTNTVTFTLYYDYKSTPATMRVNYPFSFRLPSDLYDRFENASTVNVVLKYKVGVGDDSTVLTCTMKPEDFFLNSY